MMPKLGSRMAVSWVASQQGAMVERGSELKIAAGEECLALTRVKLKCLGIDKQDGRSVGHGHQAAVEQRQEGEATGRSTEGQVRVVGPLVRAGYPAEIEQLPRGGSELQVRRRQACPLPPRPRCSCPSSSRRNAGSGRSPPPASARMPEASEARGAVGHCQPYGDVGVDRRHSAATSDACGTGTPSSTGSGAAKRSRRRSFRQLASLHNHE